MLPKIAGLELKTDKDKVVGYYHGRIDSPGVIDLKDVTYFVLFIALFGNKQEILRQFQVVQRPSGQVVLKVVRGNDWSEPVFLDLVRRARTCTRRCVRYGTRSPARDG